MPLNGKAMRSRQGGVKPALLRIPSGSHSQAQRVLEALRTNKPVPEVEGDFFFQRRSSIRGKADEEGRGKKKGRKKPEKNQGRG